MPKSKSAELRIKVIDQWIMIVGTIIDGNYKMGMFTETYKIIFLIFFFYFKVFCIIFF